MLHVTYRHGMEAAKEAGEEKSQQLAYHKTMKGNKKTQQGVQGCTIPGAEASPFPCGLTRED